MAKINSTPLWSSPLFWLGAVAAMYFVSQLLFMDFERFLAWDEAIYTSEVSRFGDAVYLDAHRARGVTLIVAPVVQWTDSILAMRVYLAAVSVSGLFLSFLPWVRIIEWAAPTAAAIFGLSWVAVFYGSEVMPNLFAALFVAAAAGLAVGYSKAPSSALLFGVAGAVAATAIIRPLDGAAALAGLATIPVIFRNRVAWRAVAGGAVGLVVGLVPWLIEAWARFGGPLARLERTRGLVGGGVHNNVFEYLRLLDGPLSGPDRNPDIPWPGVAWLCLLLALALVGLLLGGGDHRRIAGLALTCSMFLAAPYLILSEAAAPRFLLPALVLLTVGASIGLLTLAGSVAATARPIVVVGMTAALALFNLGALTTISAEQSAARARGLLLAKALEARSEAGSCYFLSSSGYPQISFATGCDGSRFTGQFDRDQARLTEAYENGLEPYVLANNPDHLLALQESWDCESITELSDRNWHLCRRGEDP